MKEEISTLQERTLTAEQTESVRKKGLNISRLLGKVIDVCILGSVVLVPLWFLPFTLDILELSKQTLVIGFSLVAVLAWIAKSLIDREIVLARSWLHLVVILFAVAYAVTTYFSSDRYLSFIGNVGQMQWSFITIASFVLFYFMVVNRLKTARDILNAVRWFLLGSLLVGLYSIFQMYGVHLLGSHGALASNAFNTIGTINALATYLAFSSVVALAVCVSGCVCEPHEPCKKCAHRFWTVVSYGALITGFFVLLIADFWPAWVEMIVGSIALFGIRYLKTKKLPSVPMLSIGGAAVVISVLMLIFPTFIKLQIPSEVSPSARHSWAIAQATLQNRPFFGSGPGTWIYDYAKYRSVAVNTSQFWAIRFDRGLSAFLTMIAMLGLVGTSLWLILVGSSAAVFGSRLVKEKEKANQEVLLTVFVGWLTLLVLAFLYNYNVVHHFAFWFFLALFGVLVSKEEFRWDQHAKSWISGLLMGLLILVGVGTISAVWISGQRLAADIKYSSAVASFQKGDGIDTVISKLNGAIALNGLNDNYHRNLSQAYLVKVSQMLQGNPDEEKIKSAGEYIQKSVNSAKVAIAQSPSNVDNYSNLGIVYQAITSFIPGADEMAIKSYEDALAFEPNNPVFMNEVGKLYVLRSDAYRTLLNSQDQKAREDAQNNVNAELDRAADWFNKSIMAKPDYAAAHYNLGLAYERQNRLSDAILKFEQVLAANNQDVSVAFQLAILYYRDGNKDASRTLFEQIVQVQPTFADARWFLSSIYEEDGKIDAAIEQVQKIKETNPDNQAVTSRLASLEQKKAAAAAPQPEPASPLSPDQKIAPGPTEQNPIKR